MHPKLARVTIGLCLAVATLGYGSLQKNVTVHIEGRPVALRTFAFDVGQALDRAGVDVGPSDRVRPPLDSSLPDGAVIEVFRAKTITLILDGKRSKKVVTARRVAGVIRELKLGRSLADVVSPARATPVRAGMTIRYRRAAAVTVRFDDTTRSVLTNAATVSEVLREAGVRLGKEDRVRPSADARPVEGMQIRVIRVGVRQEVRQVTVPFKTIKKKDRRFEYGTRKEIQAGQAGLKRIRYATRFVDGRRVSSRVLGTVMVRPVRDRIIAIGTGFPGCPCDRGIELGKATWYAQADGLSAAHKTLPFGTVVRVENLSNGKWVNVVIRDRGPYGKNRIIDLSDEAFRRIASLSTGIVNVRIRW